MKIFLDTANITEIKEGVALGEHTDQVLAEVAGLAPSKLAQLRSDGVI